MIVFPSSPVWADITREAMWKEEVYHYDSGQFQGSTAWSRPLYVYGVNAKNYQETKQNSLEAFWNSLKGKTTPFLFKDPYAYQANAVLQPTSTNMGNGSGFYLIQTNSWRVLPDSAFLLIVDGKSGTLVSSTHYVASLDNGWITTKVTVTSTWTASFQYLRKCVFDSPYAPGSDLWNSFNANFTIREILPS